MGLLRSPSGTVVNIPDDQMGSAQAAGYTAVSLGEAAQTTAAPEAEDRGAIGDINALATSALSGATLGLSDYALKGVLNRGQFERLRQEREAHPIESGIGQVAGAILPAIAAPESFLGSLPSGIVGHATADAVAAGRAIGGVEGVGRALAAGGIEGAIQNAGMYLSDTALGDRELSAEGLAASLGPGFAFGVGGGIAALGIEQGTIAARRLFSRAAGTDKAAQAAESAWATQYQSTLEANDTAADIARAKLAEARAAREQAQLAKQQAEAAKAETKLRPMPADEAGRAAVSTEAPPVPQPVEVAGLLHDRAMAAMDPAKLAAWDAANGPRLSELMRSSAMSPITLEEATAATARPGGIDWNAIEQSAAMTPEQRALQDRALLSKAQEEELAAAVAEHDAARADLDDILRRIDLPDVAPGLVEAPGFRVPPAEWGPPGMRGYDPGNVPAPGPPSELAAGTGDATAVGKRKLAEGTPAVAEPAGVATERSALYEYQGGRVHDLQEFARTGKVSEGSSFATPEEAQARVDLLDSAIAKSPLSEDRTLYRGIGSGQSGAERGITGKIEVGEVITDPGFTSTSASRDVALKHYTNKPGATLFEIEAPKGTPAASVMDSNLGEEELLLGRGSRYRITSIEKQNVAGREVRVVKARLEPSGPTMPARDISDEKEFRDMQAGLRSKLNDEEIKQSKRYTADYYIDVNRHLRGDKGYETLRDTEKAIIPALDSALEKSAIAEPIVSHRAVTLDPHEAGFNLKPGDTFQDPAYLSSSYRSDNIERFGNVQFVITSPAGTKIGAIPSLKGEGELLLARNSKLRITSREELPGKDIAGRPRVVLHATVEPAGAAAKAAPDDLLVALEGTSSKLGEGAELGKLSKESPAVAEYATKKLAKREADAAYFRERHAAEHPTGLESLVGAQRLASKDVAADDFFSGLTRPKTRDAYVAQNIGRAMREEGSHAAALAKVEREWAEMSGHPISTKAVPDAVEDVAAVAQAVTKYEKSSARLTEALGPDAPPAAQEAAKAFRDAEGHAERKTMERTTRAIDDHAEAQAARPDVVVTRKTAAAPAPTAPNAPDWLDEAKRLSGKVEFTPEQRALRNKQFREWEMNAAKGDVQRADVKLSKAKLAETEAKIGARSAKDFAAQAREAAMKARPVAESAPTSTLGAIATTIGVAGELGVPGIPKPHDIPIIGPLLGTYLKYRAIKAAAGRFAGRIPATGDARAAALVAKTKDKIATAVDRTLGLAEAAAPKARGALVATAAVLGHRLIDDGEPDAPKNANAQQQAAVRIREIANAATQPGLVTALVRKELRGVTDPDLIAAAEQHLMARFEALNRVMPKAPPPNPYSKREWVPSPAAAHEVAQRLAVVHDPEAAFHDTTPAKAETLRDVWPRLLQLAQQRLIERVGDLKHPVPYENRLRNSLLFLVPLDDSMQPDHAAVLQSANTKSQPAQPPAGPGAPTPSIAGNSNLTALYQTASDRRAMR